ncbi:AAA family ATPase [Hyphomicrobium sp.]|uniref:AAA family ATPase n=1 Tax=Hyphomicrobium sp. TaxID=82 RepID=UPI000FBB4B43|nr:AAA family ATPase [Hyphomicrobium sp.]RUO98088.1 MAG: ATPase [Hyphomicrobium sp.]
MERNCWTRYVVLSGCSGGGKSTLLAELGRRGHNTVDEPGRRIVRVETETGGTALPWVDMAAFARRAIAVSIEDRKAAADFPGWVFFDRGLVDAAVALERALGESVVERLGRLHPYNRTVFLAPPWPEIYAADAERRHALAEAIAEYSWLKSSYPRLGYDVIELPRISVEKRADLVLFELAKRFR